MFSDNTISSASELVYWVATSAWGRDVITRSVAECLYTGICTDTGSFSYSCNSPTVYNATAHLIDMGINVSDIHSNIYNSYSKERLLLLGFCINQRLRIFDDMKLAWQMAQPVGAEIGFAAWGKLEFPELSEEMRKICNYSFDSPKELENFLFE